MKNNILTFCAAALATLLATSVLAHDPKEHAGETEKPKCSAMKNMDHSKMNMDDPVMQAMMKKCMSQMNHDESAGKDDVPDHEQKSAESTHDLKSHDHSDH